MVISDNKLKEKVWNTDKELNGWLLPGGIVITLLLQRVDPFPFSPSRKDY